MVILQVIDASQQSKRVRDSRLDLQFAGKLQRFTEKSAGSVKIALNDGAVGRVQESLYPICRDGGAHPVQRFLEPSSPFSDVTPDTPEPPHRGCQPQGGIR